MIGSWSPLNMNDDDNWLLTHFAQVPCSGHWNPRLAGRLPGPRLVLLPHTCQPCLGGQTVHPTVCSPHRLRGLTLTQTLTTDPDPDHEPTPNPSPNQTVHPTALRIHEHANPPEEAGFVTSVDLYVGPPCRCRVPPCRCRSNFTTGWLFGVWALGVDPTL